MRFIIRDYKIERLGEATAAATAAEGDKPEAIYRYYKQVVESEPCYEPDKEHLVVLCLNTRLEIFGWHLACLGTLSEVSCHPREVLRPVIMSGCYGFVMVHNHPSGDPRPSRQDEEQTRKLASAADLLSLRFLDHLVIGTPAPGRQPWFSFREAGFIC